MTLSPSDQKAFAKYIKQCETTEMNYVDTKIAYNKCAESMGEEAQWWQSPGAIFGFSALGFVLGVLARGVK